MIGALQGAQFGAQSSPGKEGTVANRDEIALMAHLMRRAGFGATRSEIEARCEKGYEATVEELLNPDDNIAQADRYEMLRYHPGALLAGGQPPMGNVNWMYHLLNTQRALGREDSPLLAPRVRHRQLQGRQLRPAMPAD